MMKRERFEIANIYVPVKRRSTLKPEVVQELANSILVSVSSSCTVCIAWKPARRWEKKRSSGTLSRPKNIRNCIAHIMGPLPIASIVELFPRAKVPSGRPLLPH